MPPLTPFRIAVLILLVAAATIAGALIFQALGFAPCELCLKQRIPYYAGAPLASAAAMLARSAAKPLQQASFIALALLFTASTALGAYHAGVEFGFWPGPTDCTGTLSKAGTVQDFMKQLEAVKVVRCDEVGLRVFGLSLAAWNALISAGLAALAVYGLALTLRRRAAPAPAAFPSRS